MKSTVHIGLIGDYRPGVRAHIAIPKALAQAANHLNCEVTPVWLETPSIADTTPSNFDGLWCVPNSPYANMEAVLRAIRFARENNRPFLGTCGGFQHALLEYARNVLGIADADHAESNPAAATPLISPLSCSLVGATGTIRLKQGSRAARVCQTLELTEEYHCNYGLNTRFRSVLNNLALKITGWDENSDARIVELDDHPFFLATLFQPELRALRSPSLETSAKHASVQDNATVREQPHPLILEFVRVCSSNRNKIALLNQNVSVSTDK